jgi:hypothetical protein
VQKLACNAGEQQEMWKMLETLGQMNRRQILKEEAKQLMGNVAKRTTKGEEKSTILGT